MLLSPVSSVRYFEFPFALSCLSSASASCLDVSSPQLFSLYVATHERDKTITIMNPDGRDLAVTTRTIGDLGLSNVLVRNAAVDALSGEPNTFDCVWSISVIEHIAGDYDDRQAVKLMYAALAAGGRLILTVPVDRAFHDEYRDVDYYGTAPQVSGRYFFQRWYDKNAIWSRIVDSVGVEPEVVQWFGEREPGVFAAQEKRWLDTGLAETVNDQRSMVDGYRLFDSWESMPGQGVCGLMFKKAEGPRRK
jgi:SAM-dependent methyltransferase